MKQKVQVGRMRTDEGEGLSGKNEWKGMKEKVPVGRMRRNEGEGRGGKKEEE